MQHIIIKVFRMSVFGFYKRILHQTLLQLQRVLDVVVPSLFHLVSFWLETDIQSVFRTSVEKHQCSKCAIVTINRRYVYICHVHHGLWGHSEQLCGPIVYIYSPCCNCSCKTCQPPPFTWLHTCKMPPSRQLPIAAFDSFFFLIFLWQYSIDIMKL